MQVYVAIHDGHRTKALRIHLTKGIRNRLQEDDVASRLVRLTPQLVIRQHIYLALMNLCCVHFKVCIMHAMYKDLEERSVAALQSFTQSASFPAGIEKPGGRVWS